MTPGSEPAVPSGSWRTRSVALAEVTLAFALMHLAFRAFKRFTPLGQLEYTHDFNLSPGVAMILFSFLFITLRLRRPADYRLALRPFFPAMNAGVLCILVWSIVAAAALAFGLRRDPTWSSPAFALTASALNLGVTILMLWSLHRWGRTADHLPRPLTLAIVIA